MRVWISRAGALGALAVALLAPAAAAEPGGDAAAAIYRDLLERYANGHDGEALRRLMGLESDLVGTGYDLEQVRTIELGLIDDRLLLPTKALLPVVALHEAAYLAYQAEGSSALAFNSRTTMFMLGESFAERSFTSAERRLAGDLFASLGGYFQETSVSSTGMKMFGRSLELDPTNEAALLGATAASEQRGRYLKALGFLERLAKAHPENIEGRLRLAINLGRAKRTPEAIGLLRNLLDTQAPQWILSLAHQALARLLIDEQRMDEARRVLMDGVQSHPEDPTLPIALAWVTEVQAAGSGDLTLQTALRRAHSSLRTPPRLRYSRDPVELFEQLRVHLQRTARQGLPELARALSGEDSARRD